MYKILYIDDAEAHIEDFQEDNSNTFIVKTIDLIDEFDEMIVSIMDMIRKEKIDIVIVDFFLKQSNSRINYSGGKIAEYVLDSLLDYPIFILTAKDELALSYAIDPLHIISKESYNRSRDTINTKITSYRDKYNKKIESAKQHLNELYQISEPNIDDEQEIYDINHFLEKTIDNSNALNKGYYNAKKMVELDKMIELAERLLDDQK